ncbi:MAG: FKBP-type peptidyl-prolyl cis-trans isomerase [Bacteroidaceae bacterium]|nr:FKBP-type peptidyl-prolyl cis-trans isomerase [Bacteroidaceae bacterium]
MKRHLIIIIGLLLCAAPFFTSCSESDDNSSDNEFANWRERNEEYFASIRSNALSKIAAAKRLYSDDWQSHSDWLTYLSYSRSESASNNTAHDSIFVEVLERGTGSGCPLSTDKVRVFYAGRLMPTTQHPDGKMFDHSGQSMLMDKIFDHATATPSAFPVSELTRGFATAVQHMHIGDKWRIYIPQELGYKNANRTDVPPYSTLVFDVELVQYARAGASLPNWN